MMSALQDEMQQALTLSGLGNRERRGERGALHNGDRQGMFQRLAIIILLGYRVDESVYF